MKKTIIALTVLLVATNAWALTPVDPDADYSYRSRSIKYNANDAELQNQNSRWEVRTQGYAQHSLVTYTDGLLYMSLQDDNTQLPSVLGTWWKLAGGGSGAVSSVAGKTGDVTLVAADVADFDTEVSNNASVAANTTFRTTPSTVITPGTNLSWSGNTLNAASGSGGTVATDAEVTAGTDDTKYVSPLKLKNRLDYTTANMHGQYDSILWNDGVNLVNPAAYDSSWDGSNQVPDRNSIYDKIESMGSGGGGNVTLSEGDTAPTAGSMAEGSLFHDTATHKLYLQTATGLLDSVSWNWTANPSGGGATASFYFDFETIGAASPNIGSAFVANVGATSTAGQAGNAYQYIDGTDGYLGIDPVDVSAAIGTVDMYIRPDYSGSPAATQYFIYSGSDFMIWHGTNGDLVFTYKYKAPTHTAWSPVSGQKYHIIATWDNTTGVFKLLVDGVEQSATGVQTEPVMSMFSTNRQYKADQTFAVDELKVYKEVVQ